MSRYATGAVLSPPDVRDYTIRPATAKAPEIFPAEYMPADAFRVDIVTQAVSNCVNAAISYSDEEASARMEWGKGSTPLPFSLSYLYGDREPEDYQGEGMVVRQALASRLHKGNVPRKDWLNEYEVPEAQKRVMPALKKLRDIAKNYPLKAYARCYTVEDIKRARMAGYGILFAAYISNWLSDYYGYIRFDKPSNYLHAMTLAGWTCQIKGHETPCTRNSWGKTWGTNGYNYTEWEDIFYAGEVWALQYDFNAIPDPEEPLSPILPTLRKGSTDKNTTGHVTVMQALLIGLGYDLGKWGADGKFGDATDKAVRAYQKAKGLVVDGIVGKKTWAALNASTPTPEPIDPTDGLDPRIRQMEAFLKACVGRPYIIGGQGHAYTRDYIQKRAKAKPDYFTQGRLDWALARADGLPCYDCSGLFMAWAQDRMGIYKADMSANSIRGKCKEIKKADVRPGDILFRGVDGKATHMAIVGYDGVYEAVGTVYGVVFRPADDLFDRRTLNLMTGRYEDRPAWTHYGRPKIWA